MSQSDDITVEDFLERIATAARTGGATELDLMTLRALLIDRRDVRTIELARRVQKLEKQLTLSGMSPGERRSAICMRLRIKKTHFYELRELAISAHEAE
jgi:hypothetical protein